MSESGFTVCVWLLRAGQQKQSKANRIPAVWLLRAGQQKQSKTNRIPAVVCSERLLTKQSRFANNATLPSVPRKILPLNLSPALALMRSAADAEI